MDSQITDLTFWTQFRRKTASIKQTSINVNKFCTSSTDVLDKTIFSSSQMTTLLNASTYWFHVC